MPVSSEDLWKRAVDFHGHACPGLAIGFRMVMEASAFLGIDRASEDEEFVCITESDACCVDAAQAVLGCTLGKGNLLIKPRGKAAMSFFNRNTKRGCRVVWLGTGDQKLGREEKIALLLSPESSRFLTVSEVDSPIPAKGLLSQSLPCAKCGERTSEAMLKPYQGRLYCLECWPDHSRILD